LVGDFGTVDYLLFVDVEQKLDFGVLEQEIIQLAVFLVELLRNF
jgi:hypothetical protein